MEKDLRVGKLSEGLSHLVTSSYTDKVGQAIHCVMARTLPPAFKTLRMIEMQCNELLL